MAAVTITAKDIATVLCVSQRAVRKRAEKEKWRCREGLNSTRLFMTSFLPDDIKTALISSQTNEALPTLYNRTPVGSPELADWQNKIALARADLIRQYLAEKKRAKSKKQSVVKAGKVFIRGYNTGQLLPNVYSIIGKTAVQTIEAWVKIFRDTNYDYTVLAPKWGNRKGACKVTDEEFNTILAFGLHPNRLRIAEIARLTKLKLAKKQIPSPSSDDTLRRALKSWIKTHYDLWVFSREGRKALNDKCLPYIERDAGLLDVGEVLVADGHKLNFQIMHPFTGKPARMTMLMWYDWASCMPVGWEIMPSENIQCVAASLRHAIINLGKMPKVAYLDNGKAFKAKIFTNQDIDFEDAGFYGMFARLGIETLFAWPYNAQSKVIERFFGTFNELERLMPTYTGASIADKPARTLRNEKLHIKLHEKKYNGWVPTISETNQIIAGWLNEYAKRPHRGLKGLCPGEVFSSGKGKGIDKGVLRFLMMSMEIKHINRNGINFQGSSYYDEALYGLKERVMIRYDIEDLSQVFVYDKTGSRFICEARQRQKAHPVARISGTKEDVEFVKQGIEQKRSLEKETQQEARAYIENAPTLISIPGGINRNQQFADRKPQPAKLTRAEAEHIEAEASKMEVLELTPKTPDPVYMSEPDRYEALLEQECKGDGKLSLDDMTFMRYFEKTELYLELKERFDFLQELFLAGPEEAEVQ